MKLGRLAARRPVGLADLKVYLHNPLPDPPESVAAPQLADWGMLGNSTYGDCTICGAAHLEMATALDDHQPVPMFTDTEVESVYFDLTGGQDTGLVEADVLQAWHTTGLFGSAQDPRRIAGYAPVDHRNQTELKSVVATFGGAYLGVAVPESAQEQFQAGQPWTVVPGSPVVGGHCVPAVGYDSTYLYVVTWAKCWAVTWTWVDRYLEEAYAVITPADAVVNLAALQADLAQLEQAA